MVSTYLFPLLVYPYVSRTLGLSNVGIVNFVDSLINYFVLISMMGISTVGVREIACSRNDKKALSRTFNSLLVLTLITTFLAVLVLIGAMYVVPKLFPFRSLLYVGVIKLLFNVFLIEWFFTGMENFKYITNRSLFVKCVFVASIFLFVKSAADYKIYYVLSVSAVVVNGLINIFYSRKFISYDILNVDISKYLRPFLIMGIYVLVTNIYTSLNTVWLGFVTDTDEVGYFTTATKLHTIVMAVLTSFTSILFPRMSNLISEGRNSEYWQKISQSLDAIYVFAFPTIVFLLIGGPEALHIIVGDGFEGSYLPLQIISPLVLVIGIEQILVIQILMAMHRDSIVLRNSIIGAIVCIIVNLLLTSHLGAVGSAIVWVVSEMTVLIISQVEISMKYNFIFPYKRLILHVFAYGVLFAVSMPLYHYFNNRFFALSCLAAMIVVSSFIIEAVVLKNNIVLMLIPKNIRKRWEKS